MYLRTLAAASCAAASLALAPCATAAEVAVSHSGQVHSWDRSQTDVTAPDSASDGSVHVGIHGRGVLPIERPDMSTSPRIGWLWGVDAEWHWARRGIRLW